ncbi:MAG: tyrosine-type recombinase/integrase [Chromatiales bacterium]|jgi:integrase|nr:tyrosine-type recombinase/integrase [Chromatiales bacterium]
MALSEVAIRSAKPGAKPYKLFDERGLFLLVAGANRWWRFKYRYQGREKLLSLGVYPDVSLKDARQRRDDARRQVASGIDPSAARKALKEAEGSPGDAFEVIAREWMMRSASKWAPGHASKIKRRLELDVFPYIGSKPIGSIGAPELLKVVRRIEERGALETAHRALQNCGQVFRYAIATGRSAQDPTPALRGALPPTREKHHASITDPKAIGALLRAIDGYRGAQVTRLALQLAPLVFVRPGELRKAEWTEVDLDKSEWRIPGARMKMRQAHIVPLSEQAIAVLKELKELTGRGPYLFPGARGRGRTMSENTVNAALRRLGYAKEDMTGHGFRSMASTLLNEQGWKPDAIERQLAHGERNSIRAAYNFAEYLPERRAMMQAWANHLDTLRAGATVVDIATARAA